MQKRKNQKKNPGSHSQYRLKAVKHNPAKRRNPGVFGTSVPRFAEMVVEAIVGGLGARMIPENFLSTWNNSWAGYGLNAVTTAVIAYLGEMIRKGSGLPLALGGSVMTIGRIVQEQFGKQLVTFALVDSSTGASQGAAAVTAPAATASSLSAGDLAFNLKGYKQQYFPLPTTSGALIEPKPWSSDISSLQKMLAAQALVPGHGKRSTASTSAGAGMSTGPMAQATSTSTKKSGRYGAIM